MKQIPLTQNQFTLVDDADFDWLNQWKWHALKTTYGGFVAVRTTKINWQSNRKLIYMHRIITGCPENMQIDHKNHNPLDNRKINLRICTRSQNQQNQRSCQNKSSRYKGVSFHKPSNCWVARIRYHKKGFHLGYFTNETDAAKIYDKKAKEFFGEFACINFPCGIESCVGL